MKTEVKLIFVVIICGFLVWFSYTKNISISRFISDHFNKKEEYSSPYGPSKAWVEQWEKSRSK